MAEALQDRTPGDQRGGNDQVKDREACARDGQERLSSITPLDLVDRLLWADGSISVSPDQLASMILKLDGKATGLYVTKLSPEVEEYNQFADQPLTVKQKIDVNFPPRWNLPEKYKYLDLDEYLIKLADRVEKDALYEQRLERLATEIALFKTEQLEPIIRVLIYVIDALTEQGVVWGVGRGSSCSSYLLFLLGLHEVDPVLYGIEITDFIKSTGE